MSISTGFLSLLLGMTALLIGCAVASAGEVPIEVRDFAGIDREAWPVTGGIPLARGHLLDPNNLALMDDAGSPVPLQREVLARWDDGSVKWLLLDFFADVKANKAADYRLSYGIEKRGQTERQVSPRFSLTCNQTDEGVLVDTGCLRAVISHRLFERVSIKKEDGSWVDVVAQPGEMWMTVNGKHEGRYLASQAKDATVEIEQSGPNRVCICVKGWHRADDGRRFGPLVLRVHAYAGKPYLRVFHTFTNSIFPEHGLITGIALRIPLSMSGEREVNHGGVRKTSSGGPCSLAQTDWNKQCIVHDGSPVPIETEIPGLPGICTGGATAACLVRDWAHLYPKKLEADAKGLTVWIWPEDVGPLDLRRQEQRQSPEWVEFWKKYPKYYADWIDPGTAESAGISARRYQTALRKNDLPLLTKSNAFGLARTHEMLFLFGPGNVGDRELSDLSAALDEPLLPLVHPKYANETAALGFFGWEDRKGFPQVENYFRRKLDWVIRHQNEWARWWGMIDWGGMQCIYEKYSDMYVPGEWLKFLGRHGWKNSEVDIPVHIMYHYLRTGDRRIWRFYESIIRHQMDVDTIHLNHPDFEKPDHKWVLGQWSRGGMHRHSYDHYSGACNIGHTWNEGLVNYYFLTGDRRAYDVALEVGEYSIGSPQGKVESEFERRISHPVEAQRFDRSASNAYRNMLKCYEMTGERRWLDEAVKWRKHYLDHSPRYIEVKAATYHITTYLVRTFALDYHMFRDKAVGDELVKIARWHCDFMKKSYDERGLHYPYLACAHAWWITRDDEFLRWPWRTYLSQCQSQVDKAQNPGDFTQTHFYEFGQLPFFLRACAEAGYSEANPP